MTVKTSSVSPIRIGSSSRDMRTLYTAIEVTEIESADGEPVYTSRVIRYSDHRRNGATVIATGTTVTPGIFTPTVNATTEEKKYLAGGGIFVKTIKQQVNSIKKDFGRSPLSGLQKENLNKIASGVKKALTVASGDQQGGRGSERSSIPVSLGGSGSGGGGDLPSANPGEGASDAVDDAVGKLLTALQKHGIENNTLIMLTGDNGANIEEGGMSEPYRGGKGKHTQQEGWVHTPTVIQWPQKVSAGEVYAGLMGTIDFYATAAAAVGIALPKKCDGKNLLPFFAGATKGDAHEYLFWHNADPTDAPRRNIYAVRWKQWRLIKACLLYTSPSPRDATLSRMPSSA